MLQYYEIHNEYLNNSKDLNTIVAKNMYISSKLKLTF